MGWRTVWDGACPASILVRFERIIVTQPKIFSSCPRTAVCILGYAIRETCSWTRDRIQTLSFMCQKISKIRCWEYEVKTFWNHRLWSSERTWPWKDYSLCFSLNAWFWSFRSSWSQLTSLYSISSSSFCTARVSTNRFRIFQWSSLKIIRKNLQSAPQMSQYRHLRRGKIFVKRVE